MINLTKKEVWNKGLKGGKKQKTTSFMVECLEYGKPVLRYPSTLKKRTFCTETCLVIIKKKDKN